MKYRNIAFVSYAPFIPTQGGIQRVTDLLCRLLSARGYKVFYFTIAKPDVEYDFPAPAFSCKTGDMEDARNGECYRRFLEENGIDVIINQDGQFGSSRFLLDKRFVPGHIRTVSCVHSVPLREFRHLMRSLWWHLLYGGTGGMKEKARTLARILLFPRTRRKQIEKYRGIYATLQEAGTHMCLLSPHFQKDFEDLGQALSIPIDAIPNPSTYSDTDIPATMEKVKEVLYVGRMVELKQVRLLLDIWKAVSPLCPEWKLILLGEGEDLDMLTRHARSLKLPNVEFAGRQDPKPYYGRASILCLTSLFEGFGMVLTEAQQFGVVPIAFDSFASVHSIITPGENGELVTPFSKKEYAQKLLHLMQDAPCRERLAAKGRETVRQFSPDRIADMWDKLIQSL